jgi:hypothetical protein
MQADVSSVKIPRHAREVLERSKDALAALPASFWDTAPARMRAAPDGG